MVDGPDQAEAREGAGRVVKEAAPGPVAADPDREEGGAVADLDRAAALVEVAASAVVAEEEDRKAPDLSSEHGRQAQRRSVMAAQIRVAIRMGAAIPAVGMAAVGMGRTVRAVRPYRQRFLRRWATSWKSLTLPSR